MRILFTSLVTLFLTIPLQAQDTRAEINTQVWKPFIEAYNKFDASGFMSVYSEKVIRVPVDQKLILNYTEYKRSINREYQFNKNYNIKASLEVRFLSRVHEKETAYETGILKINLTDNNGKPATIYSRFHVLMQKENGRWRITFDSDSSQSNPVGESDFSKAEMM